MSYTSEEFRFLNNLAVMLKLGWDITQAISAIRDDVTDPAIRGHYDKIIAGLTAGGDLNLMLAESELVSNATTRLIIRAGQSSGMLQDRVSKAATLVGTRYSGGWDPYQRFLETWAVLVECGTPADAALTALAEDFREQALGEAAREFLTASKDGRSLHEVADRYPEFFSKQASHLLRYGEKRSLAPILRSIIALV